MSNPLWLVAPGRFLLVTASWELMQPDGLADDDFADADATVEGLADVAAEVAAVDVGAGADVVKVAVLGGGLGAVDFAPPDDEQLLNAMTAETIATAPPALRTVVPTVLSNVISASICADRAAVAPQK